MSDVIPPQPEGGDIRSQLRTLMSRKDELEALLEAVGSQANHGEKLVDAEGFPRADLDVHAIRDARAQVAKMQTDHQAVMKSIEKLMLQLHAEAKASKASGATSVTRSESRQPTPAEVEAQIRADAARAEARRLEQERGARAHQHAAVVDAAIPVERAALEPFYRVASVSDDSPAAVAGLRPEDLVLQFGSVTKANKTSQAMSEVVSNSIGRAIPVLVKRADTVKELRLIPQSWGGRGMLGCHLVDV